MIEKLQIGNVTLENNLILAPMAGVTDLPFRLLCKEQGAALCCMEMVSAKGIMYNNKNTESLLTVDERERPVSLQLFGSDPEIMGEMTAKIDHRNYDILDINMGCPVPKVATRANAGAYLMRNHKLAGEIMSAVVRAVQIPVSIKTRLGWDDKHIDWLNLINVAAGCGVQFAALHGRTRAQLYLGNAVLPDVHDAPIPIIANGDIRNTSDVAHAESLGYAGVMIGRGLLGRPWALSEIAGGAVPDNIGLVVLKHLEYTIEYYGARSAVMMFRKHAAWYSSGLPNSSEFRVRVNSITDVNDLKREICEFWGCELNI